MSVANMAQFEKELLVVLFLSAVASSTVLVDATFSESMSITWGYQQASIQGDDLQLVLDRTSGENFMLASNLDYLNIYICLRQIQNICVHDDLWK